MLMFYSFLNSFAGSVGSLFCKEKTIAKIALSDGSTRYNTYFLEEEHYLNEK